MGRANTYAGNVCSSCLQELLVSPYLLLQNNIPVVRCTQFPGEFIINYPGQAQQPAIYALTYCHACHSKSICSTPF